MLKRNNVVSNHRDGTSHLPLLYEYRHCSVECMAISRGAVKSLNLTGWSTDLITPNTESRKWVRYALQRIKY
uniref:Endo/exonuclease/phosphatase domain-containing protein n=1 Tax=Heterorhabditis bacteriophora TaxID=37862 RepID=A0A1I7WBX8_HETBA